MKKIPFSWDAHSSLHPSIIDASIISCISEFLSQILQITFSKTLTLLLSFNFLIEKIARHFSAQLSSAKKLYSHLYGWRSTASRLEPLRAGSLLFSAHFIDLRRINSWVDLGATQWFWARIPWIENPAP